MTDSFGDLESARATIEQQLQRAHERNVAMDALAERVSTTVATVASANGEVSVTATATAAVTDVTITAQALALSPVILGRLVTETVARAQRSAAELALLAAEETLGADSGFATSLRADVDARFGEMPEATGLQ